MRTHSNTLLAAVALLALAGPAGAGVVGCSASGGKQEVGAVVGAVAGGLLGHAVGGRHATAETVVGAGAGAAAGSAIGCEMQKDRASKQADAQGSSGSYMHNGYRLSSNVQAASYSRVGETYRATSAVNLRAGPDVNSARVGSLGRGEAFEAMAEVRGSEWILVGRDGVGVGYVRSDFVRPASDRYAER